MKKPKEVFSHNVFINCPFDKKYERLFWAAVFTIHILGFLPRCSKEINQGKDRIGKIVNLITRCKYGIHDISRIERTAKMPRFNMPFELGIDFGLQNAGSKRCQGKNILLLAKEDHWYKQYLSDLAGSDANAHHAHVVEVITIVREWLNDDLKGTKRYPLAGGDLVLAEYRKFQRRLPELCKMSRINRKKISFNDYSYLAAKFIAERRAALTRR